MKGSPETPSALGAKLERVWAVKAQLKKLKEEEKELNKEKFRLELQLFREMERLGLERIDCTVCSATPDRKLYPKIDSWEALTAWVAAKGKWQFLKRDVNAAPMREMFNTHGLLPDGVSTYTKETVQIRRKAS